MKFLFALLFLCFATISFSQVSEIEKELNTAESQLITYENELNELKTELLQQGQNFNQNAEYKSLKEKLKLHRKYVRNLRKQFKDYKKAQQQTQVAVPTTPAPSQQPVVQQQPNNKQLIRQVKQEIKDLKKQRKDLINQLLVAQQNPANSKELKQIDQQIAQKNNEIIALRNGVKTQVSAAQPQPVTQQPNQAVSTPVQEPVVVEATPQFPPIALSTILFEKLSTSVNEKYDLYINAVAKQLKEDPSMALSISAYTDNSEKNSVSNDLSEKMAHNTAQAFVSRGISPSRLYVQANGSKKPIADNKKFFGQARNRRVELQFVVAQ